MYLYTLPSIFLLTLLVLVGRKRYQKYNKTKVKQFRRNTFKLIQGDKVDKNLHY